LTGACWKKVARRIPNFLPVAGERILLFGSRDVESAEIELLNRTNVQRSSGLAGLQRRIEVMAREVAGIYVHLDLDVLDPTEATANQWATPGGASIELLLKAAQLIRRQVKITGLGIGSYDPNFDRDRKSLYAAAAFARSIFG
jgi:arginase